MYRRFNLSVESSKLSRSNISSITGALYTDGDAQYSIVPAWARGIDNTTTNSNSGEYDGGDRNVSLGAYGVDGDLLLTAGWGDGAAIRRLNNDGSMTKLWHDNNALYKDTASTASNIVSLAFHSGSSQMLLISYNVNGYSMIDYSDLKTGGTTVTNTRPSSQYVFSNGVNIDRAGSSYYCGVVTAGDWIYISDYSATHYKKYPRRHWTNGTEELIDGTSASYIYSSGGNTAATVDRNGYRAYLAYDEINDRVFYNNYSNSNFMMIVDASTANPKCVWCDLGDAGVGDDGLEQGLFVPDPTNYPNKICIGGSSRFVYCDVTNCFSGSAPQIISQIYVEDATYGVAASAQVRSGTKKQDHTAAWTDKLPSYPTFNPVASDRNKFSMDGWMDWDNNRIVGALNHGSITEDTTTGGRGRSYRSSYSNPIFRMQSANGTYWWIKVGYGNDGHAFKVWSDSVGGGLIGNWSCEFGPYTMSNSENINFVNIRKEDHFVPSNCTLNYYVSNNNGSTWESYSDGVHSFSSTGNQLKIKYTATGFPNKAPYKMSTVPDYIMYGSLYSGGLDANIPMKVVRNRIRGRKF